MRSSHFTSPNEAFLRSQAVVPLVGACVFFAGLAATARAQQTVFNVPSPDVLVWGGRYLETDQYFHPAKIGSDRAAFFLVRSVLGVGHNVEVGLNTGPFDYLHASAPFLDAAIKWRPVKGFILGDNAGVGVRGEVSGQFRNLAYGAGVIRFPSTAMRFSAGLYFATRHVYADGQRFGVQATFEQPIPGGAGLVLAADWFSGPGGFATTGIIWTIRRIVLYAGYGFANLGRPDDLVTLELGISL